MINLRLRNLIAQLILSLVFTSSFANVAQAAAKTPSDWAKLTGAAILLNVAGDAAQASGLTCNLQPDEARSLRKKLDVKIETVMKAWATSHKRSNTYADLSWPVTCQQTCGCGLDASLLEHVGLAHLGTNDRWIFRRVSTLSLEQTPSVGQACASRQTWFCESKLLKELRRSKDR